jgi:uncharacterized membrane-anchored protein YhcB (DUF1043 family)
MNETLKMFIGVASGVIVGFVVGFIVATFGKNELEEALQREKKLLADATHALKEQSELCEQKISAAQAGRRLLLTKEYLLRASLDLYANNYGLAHQNLVLSSRQLTAAIRGLEKKHIARAKKLYDQIGGAQMLTMRLDPMARAHIEQILGEIHKLPGAR